MKKRLSFKERQMDIKIFLPFIKEGEYYNYYNDLKVLIMSIHKDLVIGSYLDNDNIIIGVKIEI